MRHSISRRSQDRHVVRHARRHGATIEPLEGRTLLAAAVTHIYDLNGTFADQLGGPSMVGAGGTIGATGYTFAAGQGPNLSNAINPTTYSIEMTFKFSDVSGYRSIIDFKNRTSEYALYDYSGKAYLWPNVMAANVSMSNNTPAHLVITRDGANKKTIVYVNAVKQVEWTDTTDQYTFSAAGNIINFCRDNGTENSAGFLDRVRTYSGVLTQAEVTGIKDGGSPPGLSAIILSNGVLSMTGSAGNDTMSVTLANGTYTAKVGATTKTFAQASVTQIKPSGNDGNDTITIGANITVPTTVKGGNGNDTVTGGGGPDTFDGGAGADVFAGGGGADTADYTARGTALNIFLDGYANDGAVNERDNVKADVEHVLGGSGPDVIYGSATANRLIGNGGADYLFGLGGNDTIDGGAGDDELVGGTGNDSITGGTGVDQLFGEDGDDTLVANDGAKDYLDGGTGTDKAKRDMIDAILSIESFIA